MAEAAQGQESSNLGPAELLEAKCGPVFMGRLGSGQQSLVGPVVLCFVYFNPSRLSWLWLRKGGAECILNYTEGILQSKGPLSRKRFLGV